MLTEMSMASFHERPKNGGTSLRDFAKYVNRELGHRIIQRVREPVDRYRFEFPESLFTDPKMLPAEGLFAEEIQAAEYCSLEWLASRDQLLQLEVTAGVRLLDLLRLQRVFHFMSWCYGPKLLDLAARGTRDRECNDLVHQSAIAVLPVERLRLFVDAVVGRDRAEAALDYLTWKPGEHFDIQYRPLIRGGDRTFIPAALLASSNILRNSLKSSPAGTRVDPDDERFPALLADSFRVHTEDVRTGVSYDFRGRAGELDVIAKLGDILFVLEVKNSILPVNAHELRTSWDHIKTATHQLDRVAQLFEDAAFRCHLAERTGFSLEGATLRTAIVVTNRMFTGYRSGVHPVRGAYDFRQFLTDGVIQLGDESKTFWQGSKLTASDLQNYLDRDVTLAPLWDAMVDVEHKYFLTNGISVSVPTVVLDMQRSAENFGFDNVAQQMARFVEDEDSRREERREPLRQQTAEQKQRRKKKKEERRRRKRNRR